MPISPDDHDVRSILNWLDGLYNSTTLQGVLGADYEAIRSGPMTWQGMNEGVREVLISMVEGAREAGMEPPPPCRVEAPTPPGPTARGTRGRPRYCGPV